jgi:hypothetical protein
MMQLRTSGAACLNGTAGEGMLRPIAYCGILIGCVLLSVSSMRGEGLSQYRGLALGSSLATAAKAAGMEPSEAKAIHRRPALIQELEWQPRKSYSENYATEPVKEVVLSFFDGKLYRIAAKYDRFRTEGMTPEDLIAAISQVYGTATRPVAETMLVESSIYPQTMDVLARWEDPEYSCNLVRPAGEPDFSMILYSKRLTELAKAANVEAVRLDEQEAPQRAAALVKAKEQERQLLLDKARLTNTPTFRP